MHVDIHVVVLYCLLSHLVGEQDILVLHENGLDGVVELRVAHTGAVQSGEQVPDEPQKQWHVLKHKLGEVHVSQSSHEHHILMETNTYTYNDQGI